MKKFFQMFGLASLICFSFFYTEKTVNVTKSFDDLMIEIKEKSPLYEIKEVDAVINNNTIIPGLSGKKVDINKSYDNLKKIGSFNSKLLVYKDIEPSITLKKNLQNYIIAGNKSKNMVSLIFIVNKNTDITNILKILDKNNIKGNFFVDGSYFEQNNDLIVNLIKADHIIGNLSYNNDYNNSGFVWMSTIITKVGGQKYNYCYLEQENVDFLSICALQKSYTIKPSAVIEKNPLIEVKNKVTSGSLLSFKVNEKLNTELELIINYLKQKGYEIKNLQEHLKE